MPGTVHIPLSEVPDSVALRARLQNAEGIVIESHGEEFHFTRDPRAAGLTAEQILRRLRPSGHVEADDDWSADMESITRDNRAHDRDSWVD